MRKRNSKPISKAVVRSTELPEILVPDSAVLDDCAIYKPQCAEVAKGMRSRGASDAEICNALQIGPETLLLWQVRFNEFAEACARDGAAQMRRLESRLYDLAVGYERTEQKVVIVRGKQKVVTVRVQVPPNLEAIKLVLANKEVPESDLAVLLREISESRISRIGPVAMHPDEEKEIAPFYGGCVPERAKGWLRDEKPTDLPLLPAPAVDSPDGE